MLKGLPETVPLARMLINVMLSHSKCHESPVGANAAKSSSDQLGRGIENEGKSNAQPINGPHSKKSRTKPAEDHLIAEGHHVGQHHQTCSVGFWNIITEPPMYSMMSSCTRTGKEMNGIGSATRGQIRGTSSKADIAKTEKNGDLQP